MSTSRDLLSRFKPAGTPGAAGPAGVPVDRSALLCDELQPVLVLLADTEQECLAIATHAHQATEHLRADAHSSVAATLATARSEADSARAEAAAYQRRSSDERAKADLQRAESGALRIREVSANRLPPLVAASVHRAEAHLGLDAPTPDDSPLWETHSLAAIPSWDEALTRLAAGPYSTSRRWRT